MLLFWLLLIRAVPSDEVLDLGLLTIVETGTRLRVSPRTVTSMIRAGELESVKVRRRRLVLARSVDDYIEAHTEVAS
jgi:excisionase family DNA binding protein